MVLARMTSGLLQSTAQSLGWIVIRTKRMVSELVSGFPMLAEKNLLPLPLRGFRAYRPGAKMAILVCSLVLSGCAAPMAQYAYQGISSGTSLATNKSLPEHALSYVTSADCSVYNYLFRGREYWCEVTDPGLVYNRSGI